jgi:hypothetical protein
MPHLHKVSARVSPAAETPYFGMWIQPQRFNRISAEKRRNAQWYPKYSVGAVRAARRKKKGDAQDAEYL